MKAFSRAQLNSLYRYCYALIADESQAYDLLHNSIEKFLLANVEHIENHFAYMKRVIRNQYIDESRKRSKYVQEEYDDSVTYLDMDTDALEKMVATQHQVEEVWQQLTVAEREIMYFWAIEGYTTDELARCLDMPRGTLLSKIHRLRKRLELHFSDSSKEGAL